MFTKSSVPPPPPFGSYCKIHLYLAIWLLSLAFLTGCAGSVFRHTNENWPEVVHNDAYHQLALESAENTRSGGKAYDFQQFLSEEGYDPFGDYMNWGENKLNQYRETETLTFDENGVVMVKCKDGLFHYNPVTAAQQALSNYGAYLRGQDTKELFLKIADFLLDMEEENGSFPYPFDYSYYIDSERYYKAGWTSAMATGNILSVFARSYHLTNDPKYVEGAVRAITFLNVPIEEGGTKASLAALDPSLERYTILEEYPCNPPTYTLNGNMFTLIGLYDWSQTGAEGSERAKELFDDGIRTLEKILPYYDIGGFTCYDLAHITWNRELPHVNISYHFVHVAFCKIFYDITGIETFNNFYTLWASYIVA